MEQRRESPEASACRLASYAERGGSRWCAHHPLSSVVECGAFGSFQRFCPAGAIPP